MRGERAEPKIDTSPERVSPWSRCTLIEHPETAAFRMVDHGRTLSTATCPHGWPSITSGGGSRIGSLAAAYGPERPDERDAGAQEEHRSRLRNGELLGQIAR